MKTFPNYELVWLTHGDLGTPWAADFTAHNPGVVQHVFNSGETSLQAWKNCDRSVRSWWLTNSENVSAPWVVFLEYDVLVRADLSAAIGPVKPRVGAIGAAVKQGVRDRSWNGFSGVNELPELMRAGAIGIEPFAVFAASREALDAMASPLMDAVYEADLLSELRTPTVLAWSGFKIGQAENLQGVTTRPNAYPGDDWLGILHPVKSR